jgi:hypothetical protein
MKSGDVTRAIDKVVSDRSGYKSLGSIGASAVGNACDALLSFSVRGFPDDEVPPQLRRIFRDGHKIETVVIGDMKAAGFNVLDKNHITHKQFEWRGHGGLSVYKADAILEVEGRSFLVEIKSMGSAPWKKFLKFGVRVSHPQYYDQVQMGMGMSGILECLLVAYNKDNSMYHDEVVAFDPTRYGFLCHRIEKALLKKQTRIGREETDWRCRSCFKFGSCWKGKPVDKNTRTCAWSEADQKSGAFVCTKGLDTSYCKSCTEYERWSPEERK